MQNIDINGIMVPNCAMAVGQLEISFFSKKFLYLVVKPYSTLHPLKFQM